MPHSIRATLCDTAQKLGYFHVPVTALEPLRGPDAVNFDEPRLSPIWFKPPCPPCPSADTDMQELPKMNIRTTRYRQRGRPREECEVTPEEALANMLAATSISSRSSYELGSSVSSDSSPSPRGPEDIPRCLLMDNIPTPAAKSDLVSRSTAEKRGRKARRRSAPYSPYQYCPALQRPDRSRGARDPSPMTVVSD
ncbi:uncharacterized protein BT62DRAFT_208223 [Guyanagaster necrorhizus]|uniref:Uncharacterized protein n=1 Tax=Guyanagaster necrorhizus TaxID=856835 RepID=A0A9P7VRD7_9AGAR|nr:uncharacterized protein BT62DRAFT_208223 [Guyanagaster necrorhizus MCA 3950]KAG7445065.1 hypothetical protein BT62DRAFT_208223 [Guyanagaster necrorhizus MCA 3950]